MYYPQQPRNLPENPWFGSAAEPILAKNPIAKAVGGEKKKEKAAGHDQISIDWIKALNSSNTKVLIGTLNKRVVPSIIPRRTPQGHGYIHLQER